MDERFGLDRRVMLPGDFPLAGGGVLPELTIAYETYGKLNANGTNAILICHALTLDQYVASAHPRTGKPGWWTRLIGPGRPVDPENWFVICANVLGGCMGSTGPRSEMTDAAGRGLGDGAVGGGRPRLTVARRPRLLRRAVVQPHVLLPLPRHLGLAAHVDAVHGGGQHAPQVRAQRHCRGCGRRGQRRRHGGALERQRRRVFECSFRGCHVARDADAGLRAREVEHPRADLRRSHGAGFDP
jgi:hypothetical protein